MYLVYFSIQYRYNVFCMKPCVYGVELCAENSRGRIRGKAQHVKRLETTQRCICMHPLVRSDKVALETWTRKKELERCSRDGTIIHSWPPDGSIW